MARSIAKFYIRWIIGQDRKVAKLEKRDVATIMNTRIKDLQVFVQRDGKARVLVRGMLSAVRAVRRSP